MRLAPRCSCLPIHSRPTSPFPISSTNHTLIASQQPLPPAPGTYLPYLPLPTPPPTFNFIILLLTSSSSIQLQQHLQLHNKISVHIQNIQFAFAHHHRPSYIINHPHHNTISKSCCHPTSLLSCEDLDCIFRDTTIPNLSTTWLLPAPTPTLASLWPWLE